MIQATPAQYRRARRRLIRSALIWTPSFIIFAGMSSYFLVRALNNDSETWVAFVVTGLMGLLVSFTSISALRDLFARPIETEARIQRKWTGSDLLVFPVHHVLVGKRVFRIPKLTYLEMPETGAVLRCLHYPYTNTLVDWRPVEEIAPLRPTDRTPVTPPPDKKPADRWGHQDETPAADPVQPPTFGDR